MAILGSKFAVFWLFMSAWCICSAWLLSWLYGASTAPQGKYKMVIGLLGGWGLTFRGFRAKVKKVKKTALFKECVCRLFWGIINVPMFGNCIDYVTVNYSTILVSNSEGFQTTNLLTRIALGENF